MVPGELGPADWALVDRKIMERMKEEIIFLAVALLNKEDIKLG
jgi:hypothetical protein